MIRSSTILLTALLLVVFMGHAYMPGVAHADVPADGPDVYAEDDAEAMAQMMQRWAGKSDTRNRQDLQEQAVDLPTVQGKAIDLVEIQNYCAAQNDQHYQDCVTVSQVLDALAGQCADCRSELGYFYISRDWQGD